MTSETRDELLTNHAGRAQDADFEGTHEQSIDSRPSGARRITRFARSWDRRLRRLLGLAAPPLVGSAASRLVRTLHCKAR
jgi:hypothetical protein